MATEEKDTAEPSEGKGEDTEAANRELDAGLERLAVQLEATKTTEKERELQRRCAELDPQDFNAVVERIWSLARRAQALNREKEDDQFQDASAPGLALMESVAMDIALLGANRIAPTERRLSDVKARHSKAFRALSLGPLEWMVDARLTNAAVLLSDGEAIQSFRDSTEPLVPALISVVDAVVLAAIRVYREPPATAGRPQKGADTSKKRERSKALRDLLEKMGIAAPRDEAIQKAVDRGKRSGQKWLGSVTAPEARPVVRERETARSANGRAQKRERRPLGRRR
jgi:hypothetical protein